MVSTRVVESGITWPTWPGSTRVFARINVFIRNDREGFVLLNITTEHVSPHTRFVRRTRDFRIARHKLLVSAAQTGHWDATVSQFADTRVHERLRGRHTTKIVGWWGYEWPDRYRYLQTSRSNWKIIDFPCPVGSMANNTSLRIMTASKAFSWCSVRISISGKRSSSTEAKILRRHCQKHNPCRTQANLERV